jgi:hypothetical protein
LDFGFGMAMSCDGVILGHITCMDGAHLATGVWSGKKQHLLFLGRGHDHFLTTDCPAFIYRTNLNIISSYTQYEIEPVKKPGK